MNIRIYFAKTKQADSFVNRYVHLHTMCIILVAIAISCSTLIGQTYSQGNGSFFGNGNDAFARLNKTMNKPNVQRELKLTEAQQEEMQNVIKKFNDDTKLIRRKLDALSQDKNRELLQENPSTRTIERLMKDIESSKSELASLAMSRHKDLVAILSSTQLTKFNELRKKERARIEQEMTSDKIESNSRSFSSSSNNSMFKSFSFSTSGGMDESSDSKYFNPEEFFPYPDNELWKQQFNPFGRNSSFGNFFNFDDDSNTFEFGSPNNDGGGFNFSIPKFDQFMEQNQSDSQTRPKNNSRDNSSDNSTDWNRDSRSTPNESEATTPDGSNPNAKKNEQFRRKMEKQLQELQRKMERMQEELRKNER
jgi:Spy/CpxP family protein refolding chaperone